MALSDNATLVVGAGNYFLAPAGTDHPADLTVVATPWTNIGHTDVEEIASFESEGGEQTVLRTLQSSAVRTTYSDRTDSIIVNLQQFDKDSLKLHFGSNAEDGELVKEGGTARWLRIKSKAQATTSAFLAVYLDGDNIFAMHIPKCDIVRADNMSLNMENLSSLPIRITPIQDGENDWTIQVTPLGTIAP